MTRSPTGSPTRTKVERLRRQHAESVRHMSAMGRGACKSSGGDAMPLFGRRKVAERPVPPPNWNNVAEHLQDSEQQVATCAGWLVGDGVDHPCGVYLTNA